MKAGGKIWIPCEVKPGPFSDERMVLVRSSGDDWFGFVNEKWLQKKAEEGDDMVLATIVDVQNGQFTARIPGHAPEGGMFIGKTERAVRRDSIPA